MSGMRATRRPIAWSRQYFFNGRKNPGDAGAQLIGRTGRPPSFPGGRAPSLPLCRHVCGVMRLNGSISRSCLRRIPRDRPLPRAGRIRTTLRRSLGNPGCCITTSLGHLVHRHLHIFFDLTKGSNILFHMATVTQECVEPTRIVSCASF